MGGKAEGELYRRAPNEFWRRWYGYSLGSKVGNNYRHLYAAAIEISSSTGQAAKIFGLINVQEPKLPGHLVIPLGMQLEHFQSGHPQNLTRIVGRMAVQNATTIGGISDPEELGHLLSVQINHQYGNIHVSSPNVYKHDGKPLIACSVVIRPLQFDTNFAGEVGPFLGKDDGKNQYATRAGLTEMLIEQANLPGIQSVMPEIFSTN